MPVSFYPIAIPMSPFRTLSLFALLGAVAPVLPAAEKNLERGVSESPGLGVPVFRAKHENPYGGVRIPSVIRARENRLIVFAEGRKTGADQSNNAIIASFSDDEGRTWSKPACVANPGKDCFNNPCPVLDAETGVIFVLFQKYPDGVGERNGRLKPGISGDAVITQLVIESRDNGRSWSSPKDITATTKSPAVKLIAGGPHPGVQLSRGAHKGRLVVPYNEAPEFGRWSVYAVWSDDHGVTWRRGESAANTAGVPNETAVAELSDGSVMINARKWTGRALRKVTVSHDGGGHFEATREEPALLCNGTQGALLRYSFADEKTPGAQSLLLYSGPSGPKGRVNGAIYVSRDEGVTWSEKKVVVPGFFAYSGLVRLSDGAVGLVYESTGHTEIRFLRLPFSEVVGATPARP